MREVSDMRTPPPVQDVGPMDSIRHLIGRAVAWLCRRLCGGSYDAEAGRIVDAAIADRDWLADEVRELRIRLGELPEDRTP
jgi:hypothetical protein